MKVFMTVNFPLKKRFNKYHKKDLAFTEVDILLITPLNNEKEKTNENGKEVTKVCG